VLPRRFCDRGCLLVARALLGQWLCHHTGTELRWGRIVEVEAYGGEADPASHAARGPTPRNRPMYGEPGRAYVYLSYGMHHCLNVVAEPSGRAAAVLVRAVELGPLPPAAYPRADGPGRLCRALGVDRSHDGRDLCRAGRGRIWLAAGEEVPEAAVGWGPRVGVADPAPWRCRDVRSRAVSQPRVGLPQPAAVG